MEPRKVKRIEKIGNTHVVRVPMVWFVASIVMVVGLTLALWSAERGRTVHLSVKNTGDFGALLPSIVGLTQSSLERGNRVHLLENGDAFFPLVLRDIAAARESIHIESYIWWKGAICDEVAAALAAKARQGVEVRLLVDASGGRRMDRKLPDLMLAAGCQVRVFHPSVSATSGASTTATTARRSSSTAASATSAATASPRSGPATGRTATTGVTQASASKGRSSTACSRRSARTGSRRPARSRRG